LSKKKIPGLIKEIQTHEFPEMDYSYMKTISYSQMSIFRSCPKKWELQYKDGNYISGPSVHAVFGTALHETLQHYITVMYEISGAEADRIDIESYFQDKLGEVYRKEYESNKNIHFSNPIELREFYEDGLAILDFFKKKKGAYFSKKDWYLVGCEVPIQLAPHPKYKNVIYKGYLDLVLYHEATHTIKIIDIKTSTRGWNDKAKKDELKQFQLILYKQYFSQIYDIPVDNIQVEFFIVKRKIWEESEFAQKRIQIFSPASGKIKLSKATKAVTDFIEEAFNENGKHKDNHYAVNPSRDNCLYCPFNKKEFCDKGVSS
jgi:hypothetical protein